jgi:hypothetical protein
MGWLIDVRWLILLFNLSLYFLSIDFANSALAVASSMGVGIGI